MGDEQAREQGRENSPPRCGTMCGITRTRERHQTEARQRAARAYPGWVWSPTPSWLPDEPPVDPGEIQELADGLVQVLPARTVITVPAPGDCESLHLLAGMHEPCWLEVRESTGSFGTVPTPIDETYVRVVFSPLGRYYSLQEVRLSASLEPNGVWLEERRLVGLQDRRLQWFVKAIQGFFGKRKLVGLDAAFLAEPVPDPDGAIAGQLGAPPTLWTLLFERTPAACTKGEWLPLESRTQTTSSEGGTSRVA